MKKNALDRIAHPEHELFQPIERFFSSKKKYFLVALGSLAFIILFKNIIFLLVLGMIVMIWDYIMHSAHFPLHIDLLFFASIMITRIYGFETAFVFALITGNIPEIITGAFDVGDMFSTIPVILLCYISTFFIGTNIVMIGIIFSLIFAIIEFLTALTLAEPPLKVIVEPLCVLILNLFLFIRFSGFIEAMF